jgi:TetR/AcrR family transcriptional regulator, regulator of autoinduction and epiphytic fitness
MTFVVALTREPDPRLERTRQAVLDAALDLLVETSYGDLTVEAVAARSGVAKSTIYRHWPGGRADLVHDAFQELEPPTVVPTEGTVRERVTSLLEQFASTVYKSRWSLCLPALIEAAERDPVTRELHGKMSERGRRRLVELLEEGVLNGELPAGLDAELVAEAIAGPIILRRLMSLDPLEPSRVRTLVEQVLGRP